MRRHALARAAAALASTGFAGASIAADIVLTPPASGGVTITNAAGNANRLRVGEDGTVAIPEGMRIQPGADATTVVFGRDLNFVGTTTRGATIGGGGAAGNSFNFGTLTFPCLSGGCANAVTQHGGFVGGGFGNIAGDGGLPPTDTGAAMVGGGIDNVAGGGLSAILGGRGNRASGNHSSVAGGMLNQALGDGASIAGGTLNNASGVESVIGGGFGNAVAGIGSTIPGGRDNMVTANYALAAGFRARAMADGTFAWADSGVGFFFDATTVNEFAARARGGFRFVTSIDGAGVPTRTFAFGATGRMTLPDDFAIYRGANPFAHMNGTRNAFLGQSSGAAIAAGFENAALGYEALLATAAGAGNTAVGYKAMSTNVGGFNSTAVGAQALVNATGGNNLALGAFAGSAITNGTNNIMIGNGGAAADSNVIRLGGTQSSTFVSGIRGVTTGQANAIQVFIDSNGQLGTASSSRAVKQDIADMGDASEALMRLHPVTFRYKSHVAAGQDALQYGLVAEEVAEVAPELAARGADGRIETVHYEFLAPMLVNEVQRQRRVIAEQSARMRSLEGELAAIRQALGLR